MMHDVDDDILPYSSICLAVGNHDAASTVMCYGVRLHIRITGEDLQGGARDEAAAEIRHEFENFLRTMDDEPEAMQAFQDWLLRPCLPHIRHLINLENGKGTTSLQGYFHPKTLIFSLQSNKGRLEAVRQPNSPSMTGQLFPKISISEPAVAQAIHGRIPCILASQLMIIRDPDLSDWECNDVPQLVQKFGTESQLFHFKPAFEKGSFTRELDVLLRIMDMDHHLNVTRLAGLVKWDDNESIGGLLVEYIPEPKTLDWAVDGSTPEERVKWMAELRNTVRQLHSENIIWGDVKPQNVIIDPKGQAWVVDFGGGHSLPWVDEGLGGTVEGDLQGLNAIAKYLGL